MTWVPWIDLQPNTKNAWITEGLQADFEDYLPIASKEAKASKSGEVQAIFKTYSLGVSTNRDSVVYDYNKPALEKRIAEFISSYNEELQRWKQRPDKDISVDEFVSNDSARFKWSEHLKNELKRGKVGELNEKNFHLAMYRPFDKEWLYNDTLLVDRPGGFDKMFPNAAVEKENLIVSLSGMADNKPFQCLATNALPDLHLTGDSQCFPLYTYALDGRLRRDNVTDWALAQFQAQYGPDVTKRDIFHYVYGLLHSPEYRERYKENLKRELPRVPLVGEEEREMDAEPGIEIPVSEAAPTVQGTEEKKEQVVPRPQDDQPQASQTGTSVPGSGSPFRRFVAAGEMLAALHVGYEQSEEYLLTPLVNKDVPFSWRVTKMRLTKDKTAVVVNESLTLAGIPPETFDYKLGNRSALEWVLDQYQVSTDKRSGIETDPNRADDPEYIVRLVRRVVTVSVETVKIVLALPNLTTSPA